MAHTDLEIVKFITNHVGSDGYSSWYVGIASDPKQRLFNDHNVDEQNGKWAYSPAINEAHARSAEKILHDKGFDGGIGGGDQTTIWVYAYKKTSSTVE